MVTQTQPVRTDPLFELEKMGKYGLNAYTYPSSNWIDGSQPAHMMNFYVNANVNSNYSMPFAPGYTTETKPFHSSLGEVSSRATDIPITAQTKMWGSVELGANSVSDLYKRTETIISLYMPSDSITFASRPNWEDVSLTELGGDILRFIQSAQEMGGERTPSSLRNAIAAGAAAETGQFAMGVAGKLLSEKMKQLGKLDNLGMGEKIAGSLGSSALNAAKQFTNNLKKSEFFIRNAGFAVNPQIMVMYKDIGMRTFSFSFIFTPHDEREAANVRDIVKLFRFHAHPEVTGVTGRFHIAPSTFDIDFIYKGKRNTNIPKISTCAITGISVDYSPYGWSTFTDGMPVQTHLTMHFKEMEVMTKDKIERGF